MSADRFTFDTNILFYAADIASGVRHHQARQLLSLANEERTIILVQALGEFIHSVGRKRPAVQPEAREIATKLFHSFSIIAAEPEDFEHALSAQQQHSLPFWDAMLWATCRRAGCSLVLTEDFQDGRTLDGVTFRNPFKLSATELDKLIG